MWFKSSLYFLAKSSVLFEKYTEVQNKKDKIRAVNIFLPSFMTKRSVIMSKKEKIIQSALYLFSRNGFTETSIDKIAKHAKVSKGLTYTHFKNKDDLLRVIIESTVTQMTKEMMEIKELTIESLLLNFFDGLQKNIETIRLCVLLLIHPQTPSSVTQMLAAQKEELLELLTTLLEGKFKENSSIEAELLLATIDGITLDYAIKPTEGHLEKKIDFLLKKYT